MDLTTKISIPKDDSEGAEYKLTVYRDSIYGKPEPVEYFAVPSPYGYELVNEDGDVVWNGGATLPELILRAEEAYQEREESKVE